MGTRPRGLRLRVRDLVLMVAAIAVLCAMPGLLFPTLFVGPLLFLLWRLRRAGWGYSDLGLLGAVLLVPALFLAFVAFVAYTQIPFVYYAGYRGIERRLQSHPGVKIVGSWKHEDLTLEDCGFIVQVRDCAPVHLYFDPYDWKGDFRRIEAVSVSREQDFQKEISVAELAERGLPVRNLSDILDHMEGVLALVAPSEGSGARRALPGTRSVWEYLTFRCVTRRRR